MKLKSLTVRHQFFYTILLGLFVTILIYLGRSPSNVINILVEETLVPPCFQQQSINHQQSKVQNCLPDKRIISSVWTHDGTGIMKYIQWIVTRKLGNIKISQLND